MLFGGKPFILLLFLLLVQLVSNQVIAKSTAGHGRNSDQCVPLQ